MLPCWRRGVTGGRFWGFKSLCHSQLALFQTYGSDVISQPLLQSAQPLFHLPACSHVPTMMDMDSAL